MKKLRPDSTFARLTPEQLAEVDDALLSNASYESVREMLAEWGHKVAQQNVAEYYHRHLAPQKWARQARVAQELREIPAEGVDDATLLAVRQATLELALTPGSDPKALRMLYDLVLKAQAQQLDERRLALMEAKARKAEEAEAAAKDEALTEEERQAKVLAIFGMS